MPLEPEKPKAEGAPRRYHLFLEFSILSFAAFLLIGYFVVGAIRPAIFQFVVSRQEADVVVFVNRFANRLLQPQDFQVPLSATSTEALAVFVEGLLIPARLAVSVADPTGSVLVSDLPEAVGISLAGTAGFSRAARDRRSFASIRSADSEESELLGADEVFELFIPVTFGASTEVAGVVHSRSRTGFIREAAARMEREMALRISVGLLFLYLVLAVIVWGASRTIRRQAAALHGYAVGLEEKVKERTRELEESAARELAAAKEVARLKDEFVFVATHELRAPVTAMRWGLELIEKETERVKAIPKALRDHLSIITTSVERLHQLIQDLLSVSRLEAGAVKVIRQPFALSPVVEATIAEAQAQTRDKGISIRCDPAEFRALPAVLGDEKRIGEVLVNLISNAVKFNRAGGRVMVGARVRGSTLEISVTDTGIGIKPEDIPKLFTKFFRVREDVEGTGLGLWISREIMRRLDGDIVVESEADKGSTFTVKIPLAGK